MKYLLILLICFVGCSRDNDHPAFSLDQPVVSDFSRFHLKQLNGTIESLDSEKLQLDTTGIFYSYTPTMEFIGKMGPYDVQFRLEDDHGRFVLSGRFGPIGSVTGNAYLSSNNGIYMDFYGQDLVHYRGTIQ
ncbi:hypothetical protein MJH12_02070 [bacterium]|nr:hypothetical protein [bacterium]